MKKRIGLLCAMNVVFSAILIGISLLSKMLIDSAESHNIDDVILYGSFIFIAILVDIIIRLVFQKVYYSMSVNLEMKLKKDIYVEIMKKEITEIDKYHSGEISNIYQSDVRNIVDYKLNVIPSIFLYISRFLFAVIVLFFLSWQFLLAIFGFGILAFIFAYFFIKKIKPLQKETLFQDGLISSFTQETAENLRIIKAYSAEDNASNRLDIIIDDNKKVKRKRNNFNIAGSVGIYAVMNISYIAALVYGAYAIAISIMTYGTLMAIVQLVNHFEAPFIQLSGVLNKYSMYKASKERINAIYSLKDDILEPALFDFDEIIFDKVSFSYDKIVHKNLSFTIKKGEKVLLEGPSGIGKTTIFKMLLGFVKITSGRIYVKYGKDIFDIGANTRTLFAYVPQENIIFSGTIRDNILMFADASEIEMIDALKKANVYTEIDAMPKKLDTKLKERGTGLSLGQIQRIMIACALLKNREILLLDEFSSALDKKNETELILTLSKLNKTIVYITHKKMDIEAAKVIKLEAPDA